MIYGWLAKKLGQAGAVALLVVLTFLLIGGVYYGVKRFFTAGLETQLKVSNERGDAGIASGRNAVNTAGNRAAAEAAGAANVQESQDAIDHAADPGAVTDAGLAGLHSVRGKSTPSPRR